MRKLSIKLNVSVTLLSLIVKGERALTEENVDLWAPIFAWSNQEISWIKQIILLESSDLDKRHIAIKNLSRFKDFKQESHKEVLTYKYLKKWWNVAIREMSHLPDFQMDEAWIQKKLLFDVSLIDIRKSLTFLQKHKLLANQGDFRQLDCQADIYKLSLSTFHSQMLQKAVESIHKVSSEKRYILGHTMCLNESNFEKARLILQNALLEITQLNQNSIQENDVYHFGFIGFPLTSKQEDL